MHADPRSARDFRAALARWQESGELPANRQIAVMVALATLDRAILKRLQLRPEQAWNELDAPARTVIASWARRNDSAGTEPTRERVVAPTTGKRVPRHLPTATQLREMRRQRGEQQRVFWSRFGVTQSGGSRYEADRELNAPLGLLLALWESGALSPEDLDELGRYECGDLADLPAARQNLVRLALDDPKALRERIAPDICQSAFWNRLGLTQSGGWRHENSRRHNGSLRRLLIGLAVGRIDEAMLAAVSDKPPSA